MPLESETASAAAAMAGARTLGAPAMMREFLAVSRCMS